LFQVSCNRSISGIREVYNCNSAIYYRYVEAIPYEFGRIALWQTKEEITNATTSCAVAQFRRMRIIAVYNAKPPEKAIRQRLPVNAVMQVVPQS
jgi:hypothetical protein